MRKGNSTINFPGELPFNPSNKTTSITKATSIQSVSSRKSDQSFKKPPNHLSKRRTTSASSTSSSHSLFQPTTSTPIISAAFVTSTSSSSSSSGTIAHPTSSSALESLRMLETNDGARELKIEQPKRLQKLRPGSINTTSASVSLEEHRESSITSQDYVVAKGKGKGKEEGNGNGNGNGKHDVDNDSDARLKEEKGQEEEDGHYVSATAIPQPHYRHEQPQSTSIYVTAPLQAIKSTISIGATLAILPFKLAIFPARLSYRVTRLVLGQLPIISSFMAAPPSISPPPRSLN